VGTGDRSANDEVKTVGGEEIGAGEEGRSASSLVSRSWSFCFLLDSTPIFSS
jgi:hypothetical protein